MKMTRTEEIIVIGAGVIGLTTALRLQERGHKTLIIAKHLPGPFETMDSQTYINYTSPWGGAHLGWSEDIPAEGSTASDFRDHSFALTTYAQMARIHATYPESGVTFLKGVNYYEKPVDKIRELDSKRAFELGIKDFAIIPPEDLPERVQVGYSYTTWCVNPMVYCSFLLRRFVVLGGRVLQRELRHPVEIFETREFIHTSIVVNASGYGFNDENVFITRGQTCLVANDCNVTISRHNADGSSSFCIPRKFNGGTIIGGTKEPNCWAPEPTPGVRDNLLRQLKETYPPILGEEGAFVPLRDIVGRRPTRKGGMRVEREDVADGKAIIHAYGAGGRGYELSWGVAGAVANLISEIDR